MPFDGLPENFVPDLIELRIALDGVRGGASWAKHTFGDPGENHCAVGWLLEATGWNRDEAVRLACRYVYPALPPGWQKKSVISSIISYNDSGGSKRVEKLFERACGLALEAATVR